MVCKALRNFPQKGVLPTFSRLAMALLPSLWPKFVDHKMKTNLFWSLVPGPQNEYLTILTNGNFLVRLKSLIWASKGKALINLLTMPTSLPPEPNWPNTLGDTNLLLNDLHIRH